MSLSAKVEYFSRSTSPSSRKHLQAAHWPSLQPCGNAMPWRKAAFRTVSPSWTSNSTSTGTRRTVYASLINPPDYWARRPVAKEVGAAHGPHRPGRSVAGVDGEPCAIVGQMLLALLR